MAMRTAALALALPLLLSASTAAARHRDEAAATRIHRLIFEGRVEEARAEVKAMPASRLRDPEMAIADGDLRFNLGDYAGAAQHLREALSAVRLPPSEGAEWRGLAELSASTAEVMRNFQETLSPGGHFLIRYAPGKDALLAPYAGEALEKAWAALGADFSDIAGATHDAAQPVGPVRVEIYGEVADLARVSTLTLKEIETSGTIALCKWNRLMIVSPRALVRGYPWIDTLVHEYTHFIVARVSRNTVPIWLHEGLAKFEERRWRGPSGGGMPPSQEHLLWQAVQHKRFITFEQMYPSMAKLPSQEDTALAFAEVYTVVEYLYQRTGWPGIRKLIAGMAGGAGDGHAVAATLGVSFADFDRSWKAWLKTRKGHGGDGRRAVALKLKFKKGPAAGARSHGEGSEDDDSGEIPDGRARNFARLANLLRERRRLHAAAVEYEKAAGVTGPQNPIIAAKLARIYLELGEPDKAIAAAEPARELYPDLAGLAVTLGGAWLRKGDMAKAATYLETALRQNPFDPAIHCGLAEAWQKLQNPLYERAAAACRALQT